MSDVNTLGTEAVPLRVAIVGSGPSGFYAAEALLRSDIAVRVDMLERLPAPYGLVRSGVAPDHPKLKEAIRVYDRIAQSPEFTFFGNVTVGRDISIGELRRTHHAILFACGAETDRRLGIPGEDLPGSHTATEFVGWYNGHPDYRDRAFDLSQEVAVVIGQGNVAVDVCRILGKTADELKHTDIAEHALAVLAESKIREIHMVGRRGPAQAKFTYQELRELGELADCDPVVDPAELELNPASLAELADKAGRGSAKNVEILRKFAARPAPTKGRRCHIRFLLSPIRVEGRDRLERVVFAKNRLEGEPFQQVAQETEETLELECGLVFRSIGYRGVPIPGAPFDERRGIFPNLAGRLLGNGACSAAGLYATGWIKRGPTGIIGTNRADSMETVKSLLADLPKLDGGEKSGSEGLRAVLEHRGVRFVNYPDWQKIDTAEIRRGEPAGKPREKFTTVDEMLAHLE
jgi:ferredoxin/flavodoxin---NADP+ reductase